MKQWWRTKKRSSTVPNDGTYLFSLAFANLDLNNYQEAERIAERALELDEKRFNEGDPELAQSYYKDGASYVNQEQYSQGEQPFRKALKAAEQSSGLDSPLILSYIDNLAIVCSVLGKKEEAEALIKRAQAIEMVSLSPDDPENVETRNKLASL